MQNTTTQSTKCLLSKIKRGDKLSVTYYLNVINKNSNSIDVEDQTGAKFAIQGKELIEETLNSADQFTEVKNVSRTEVIEILEGAGDTVFQVTFLKQATEETVAEALGHLSVADLTTPKTLKKHLKSILLGEERKLIGHLLHGEPKMGRTQVVDLEVPKGQHNIRLVDNRSISSLILKGVKYTVK